VVRLARSGPREATVALPETVRPPLGSTAKVTLFDGGRRGEARLRQLSDAADPQTRTYEARYVLDGAASAAPLGATVTIILPVPGDTAATLQAPLSAIHDSGKGPGVWVIDPKTSTVNWRPVRVSAIGEETAVLSGGLNRGERFVALGAHLLHQGQRVRTQTGAAQ
ncbi:MAG TPA: efflux RND transporter periplasmic adaptor subunit, partial [Caulobacter sp.]|nr:efflux RND transporter periplasmic adaptor subunit [Caulobacter sp.]